MPLGLRKFKIGGVVYPLTADTTNSLLRDGDPALYYALDMFQTVIAEYVGDRILAQAALNGFNFQRAVGKAIHYEPSPFLQNHDMVFPLFALYRSEESCAEFTASFDKFSAVWCWAYVMPPMTPRQIEQLDPVLHSVASIVSCFAQQSFDPSWQGGKTLRDLSGIQKMDPGPVKYLDIEMLDGGQNQWWRAVSGKILVKERTDIVLDDLDVFEGANIAVDLDAPEGKVVDYLLANTYPPPVLETVQPAQGTKAGSAFFEIIGTGFRPGTPAKVLIGGAYAGSVYVTSPFRITGLTPAHDANPTYAADVVVIDADGMPSNTLAGAYTFTTP